MNQNEQFTYTDTFSPYNVVITKLADGLFHWQVIDRHSKRVIRQSETEGLHAQFNALQQGLDALRDIRNGQS